MTRVYVLYYLRECDWAQKLDLDMIFNGSASSRPETSVIVRLPPTSLPLTSKIGNRISISYKRRPEQTAYLHTFLPCLPLQPPQYAIHTNEYLLTVETWQLLQVSVQLRDPSTDPSPICQCKSCKSCIQRIARFWLNRGSFYPSSPNSLCLTHCIQRRINVILRPQDNQRTRTD